MLFSLALAAHETVWMVGVAKNGHHLTLRQLSTCMTLAAEQPLIIISTEMMTILGIKCIHCQWLLAF